MKLSKPAFSNVLSARGLNVSTLAARSGVSASALRRALNEERDLEDDDIVAVADELAVPVQALFAHTALPLFPSVDFRTVKPGVGEFEKGTLKAISFVERLSAAFQSLELDVELDPSVTPFKTATYSQKEAVDLAAKWRAKWGISDDEQLDWQNANKLYVSLRDFIEGLGILVVHRQFRTAEAAGIYVHIDGGPHTIVINTTNSGKARKLFTLAHEFGHVLIRAEGASNPSILRNRIERFCNRFAACLLAPKRLIKAALQRFGYRPSPDDRFIRLFASKLGISQEATFLRLVETDFLQREDYERWKRKFDNTGSVPLDDTTDGGGGGGTPDPIRDKRTQFGSALLNLLGHARRSGKLDEIDVYRICGLKPQYQEKLFGFA